MQYKGSTIAATKLPDKMTVAAPVAIGTRGTVGSLVRKEIEYFTRFELDKTCGGRTSNYRKSQSQKALDLGSTSTTSSSSCSTCGHHPHPASCRPSFWSLKMSWKWKKRRCSSGSFLPSICSAVEVADTHCRSFNGIPGFSYTILRDDDVKSMDD